MTRRLPPVFSPLARPTLAVLAALVLAACAGTGPSAPPTVDVQTNPYAAFPPPRPLDPRTAPPEPRPITARITHRAATDPEVFRLLDRLSAAVERKQWRTVAMFLEEDALAEQMGVLTGGGLSPQRAAADALAGALGLDFADAPLFPPGADRDARPFLGLDRLQTMTVQLVEEDAECGGRWLVQGYVRLDDRATREYRLYVIPTPRGLRVAVPMG